MALPTASDNVFPKVILAEGAAPSTPSSGQVKLYAKTDGLLYSKDDAGAETALGGAAGGITHAYVGYNTVGGSTEALVDLRQYYKKVTLASACMIESVGVYIKQVTAGHVIGMAAGVLQDTGGTPDSVLAYNNNGASSSFLSTSNGAAGAARWVHLPIGLYVAAGDYWLSVCLTATAAGHQLYYDGSGSDQYHLNGALRITDSGWTTVTTSSNKYSIRASTIA